TEAKESPITRIFGGKIRSVVRCPGQKDSVTLEPYLTLQLDIQPESVFTISDALTNFHEPEIITGLTNAKGAKVDGTKQVFIETLPHVLVLHLKRFLYDKEGGAMKSGKIVGYDTELEIPKSVLSPAKKGKTAARYQLFGVIYHHGRSTAGGHYTAAVRQPASPHQWINIDDTLIRPMDVKEVAIKVDHNSAHAHEDRWGSTEKNAYLLFYLRVA
ncbi:cysteine proteinase, partial [Atractiella rhizophila]